MNMSKKLAAFLTSSLLAAAVIPAFSVSAADTIQVNVAISTPDSIVVANKDVTVTDRDDDGKYTIDEVLYAAHETYFEGGAAAGYASSVGDYGLMLTKLWGIANGINYGYYLNDQMSMGLSDTVKEGDYLSAFVYKDSTNFSDRYSYFDVKNIAEAKQGDTQKLKLSYVEFDAQYNPVAKVAADAVITVDGEKTTFKTDENGEVTLTFEKAGNLVISAVSDDVNLVPAVLTVNVAAAETTAPETTTTAAETTTTTTAATTTAATTTAATTTAAKTTTTTGSSSKTDAAKTGDTAIPAVVFAAALASGVAYATRTKSKSND